MKHMKQLKYVLAGIVALTTVFALIRPAITLETICGKEEHTHSQSCYKVTQETIVDQSIDCSYDSLHVHVHSPSCYNQDNELICGYADYLIHEHNEDCYNENNELICPLPEIKEHSHDSSCYDSENHLICGQQEIVEHKHNSSCYDQEGNLICDYPELEKHDHDENCITKTERILEDKELICTKEEHVHTEECYPDETEYVCGKEEHVHDESCYDSENNLICEKEEHTHTDDCLTNTEETNNEIVFEENEETVELNAQGEDYSICVKYNGQDVLPEDVTLNVAEVSEDSEEYEGYLIRTIESIDEIHDITDLSFVRFFDIEFISDGQKVEPTAPVFVTITYNDVIEIDGEVKTVHFTDDETEIIDAQVEQKEQTTCFSHTQSSFSVIGNIMYRSSSESSSLMSFKDSSNQVTFKVKTSDGDYKFVDTGTYSVDTDGKAYITSQQAEAVFGSYGYKAELGVSDIKYSYDDIYRIQYVDNDGNLQNYSMDVASAAFSSGTQIQLWANNDTNAQKFRIRNAGGTSYYITPYGHDDLYVNVANGNNETSIFLSNGTNGSTWNIKEKETGYVNIETTLNSGTYINLDQGILPAADTSGKLHLYAAGNNNNWKLNQIHEYQDAIKIENTDDKIYLAPKGNGSLVCVYDTSQTGIYNQGDLKKLETSGSYYLQEDIYITTTGEDGCVAEIGKDDKQDVHSTLYLNGHTITYDIISEKSGNSLFWIHKNGSLTIEENQPAESVEAVSQDLFGNLATYENNILTYYVTEVSPNLIDGTTTDTLMRHTVNLSNVGGIISTTSPQQFIYVQDNSSLTINGGRYSNPNGYWSITSTGNATLNINGGYFYGNRNGIVEKYEDFQNYGKFGGSIHSESKGSFNITGGVIAANNAGKGGGVYAANGTFTMTGGVISGNLVAEGNVTHSGQHGKGGGLFLESVNASISGGYVTNNKVDYQCTSIGNGDHYGGGIVQYSGNLTISNNAYVTGNYHKESGGGIGFCGNQFVMTGGYVSSNVAQNAEGGGIRISNSNITSLIEGGYISNNYSNTNHDWGGGGIFVQQDQSLQIKNAIFTQNTANGFGGGVGGCSTGQIVAVDNTHGGVAIYGNSAEGRVMAGSDGIPNSKQDDLIARANEVFMKNGYNDFFCALNSSVSGTMLGDGDNNWHGSCDFESIDITKDNIVSANSMMGLNANPNAEDIATAKDNARVFITGNHSGTHGGGIMSNGILILGNAKDVSMSPGLQIDTTKVLKKGNENGSSIPVHQGQFEFLLLNRNPIDSNGNTQYSETDIVARTSNDLNGNVVIDIGFDHEGTYTYYLLEKNEGLSLVTYDPTVYEIEVTVGTQTKELKINERTTITITYYLVNDVSVKIIKNPGTLNVEKSYLGHQNHKAVVHLKKTSENAGFTNIVKDSYYFRIKKVNQEEKPLQFVEFILKDNNGQVITSKKTDKDGYVSFLVEKGKTYQVFEKRPENYLGAGPWILEVNNNGDATIYDAKQSDSSLVKDGSGTSLAKTEKDNTYYFDYTIVNTLTEYKLPETGGPGDWLYIGSGIGLIMIAGYFLIKRRIHGKEDIPS